MSTTLLQIRNEIYDALAEETDSTVFPSSFIDSYINQAHTKILEQREFSFMETETLFTTAVDTTIDGALTTASTTITLDDSTGWSATSPQGSAAIGTSHDVIAFTGISGSQLTGVTGISIAHVDGVDIRPIYSITSNIWKVTRVIIDGNEVQYFDYRDTNRDQGYFIYNGYFYLPSTSESQDVKIQYFKLPTTLSSDSDATEIPDRYAKMLIVPYVVSKALLFRDEDQRSLIYEREFEKRLSDVVKSYGFRTLKFRTRITGYREIESREQSDFDKG